MSYNPTSPVLDVEPTRPRFNVVLLIIIAVVAVCHAVTLVLLDCSIVFAVTNACTTAAIQVVHCRRRGHEPTVGR